MISTIALPLFGVCCAALFSTPSIASVSAWPTGSGVCYADDSAITSSAAGGMGTTNGTSLDFAIKLPSATVTPGQKMTIDISSASAKPFTGFLIYAADLLDDSLRYGSWATSSASGIGNSVVRASRACPGAANAQATHTSASSKSTPFALTWTAPTTAPKSGSFVFRGIAVDQSVAMQIMTPVIAKLATSTSAASGTATAASSGASQAASATASQAVNATSTTTTSTTSTTSTTTTTNTTDASTDASTGSADASSDISSSAGGSSPDQVESSTSTSQNSTASNSSQGDVMSSSAGAVAASGAAAAAAASSTGVKTIGEIIDGLLSSAQTAASKSSAQGLVVSSIALASVGVAVLLA